MFMVVHHLHGETGSATVCLNSKQKCEMASFVRVYDLPEDSNLLKETRTIST